MRVETPAQKWALQAWAKIASINGFYASNSDNTAVEQFVVKLSEFYDETTHALRTQLAEVTRERDEEIAHRQQDNEHLARANQTIRDLKARAEAAEQRNRELTGALESAPHSHTCATETFQYCPACGGEGDSEELACPGACSDGLVPTNGACNCWKSRLALDSGAAPAKPHDDTERLDKWISVKERLPEPNVSVLVFMPNTEHYGPGIQRAIRVCPTAGPEPGLDYRWHGCAWMIGRDIPSDRITHWMPLPSIPNTARLASPQPGE